MRAGLKEWCALWRCARRCVKRCVMRCAILMADIVEHGPTS